MYNITFIRNARNVENIFNLKSTAASWFGNDGNGKCGTVHIHTCRYSNKPFKYVYNYFPNKGNFNHIIDILLIYKCR